MSDIARPVVPCGADGGAGGFFGRGQDDARQHAGGRNPQHGADPRETTRRDGTPRQAAICCRCLGGGWLIDTPGMRELRLTEADEGTAALFDDLDALASTCRFQRTVRTRWNRAARSARRWPKASSTPSASCRWEKLRPRGPHQCRDAGRVAQRDRAFGRMVRGATAPQIETARRLVRRSLPCLDSALPASLQNNTFGSQVAIGGGDPDDHDRHDLQQDERHHAAVDHSGGDASWARPRAR